MRLIYLNGYTRKDAMAFREPIVLNLMRNMVLLVEAAEQWQLAFAPPNLPEVSRLKGLQVGPGLEVDKGEHASPDACADC